MLCSFTLSRDEFKVAKGKTKATAAARGTTLRLDSSAAGTAIVSLRSRRSGLRIKGRCRVDSPARRKRVKKAKRCQRPFDLVVFKRAVPQGASTIRFTGRLKLDGRTKRLYPGGPYVLTTVVQDAAGRTSAPRSARFTILP